MVGGRVECRGDVVGGQDGASRQGHPPCPVEHMFSFGHFLAIVTTGERNVQYMEAGKSYDVPH